MYSQTSFFYRCFVAGDATVIFKKDGMVANMESWGVVFNSFAKMEEHIYPDHVKMRSGPGRAWAVDPLLPPIDDSSSSMDRGGSSYFPPEMVLTFLDYQKENSMVCFGSRMMITDKEMDVLGTAVELSGVHFIWCSVHYGTEGNNSEKAFRNIPGGISKWKKLYELNLGNNHLSSNIPPEIGSLSVRNDLDLLSNQFSGIIPT